jgi:cysteine desulfurase
MRAGTENVAFIVGMAKALELAYKHYSEHQAFIAGLKNCLASNIKDVIPSVVFNSGRYSLYSVLSVSFPKNEKTEFLLMELDQKGICASGGSACSGGGSHVMKELGRSDHYVTIRFSLSKYNTKEEIDKIVEVLQEILHVNEPVAHNP